jgi:acyl transferase domain-containing protein
MSNLAWQEPIAIIGMAGRFPGALDLGQFWTGLHGGVQSIRFRTDDELLAEGVPAELLADARYVKATATAPEIDGFDAGLFGLSPRQARVCDPQARLFLECAHAALEDAGYDVEQLTDVGVFGSAGVSQYLDLVRRSESVDLRSATGMALKAWNSPDYLAPLVSRQLGLRGPSLGVQAAGASSLLAVHLAAASLRAGECELALAGGVEIELPLNHGYRWEPGRELSRDGRCRPFDKAASGTILASGAGVVVLKRLDSALADADHIWAVLRSTAVNNDGSAKAGASAPSVAGQSAAIAAAMMSAGVRPSELTMVEAHAAGDPHDDGAEVTALKAAWNHSGKSAVERCALTSVKGNLGHLGHAAGVTSLIKVALSLTNEAIPATVGYQDPHPALGLGGSPFYIPTHAVGWPRRQATPRVAGVNAAGAGGISVHAIVAEAPAATPVEVEPRPRIVVWSARTPAAAERYRQALAGHFSTTSSEDFVRSVATLQHGRTPHSHRGAVVAADAAEAVALLGDPDSVSEASSAAPGQPSRIAFLFPGQGAQHAGVAQDLYDRSPSYAEAFDECLDLFEAADVPLRRWWREGDEAQLHSPRVAVPLTFAVEYALARAWQSWGITPAAVLGLSIGEMTAATVAGIFSVQDAVQAIAVRSQAVQDLPPGGLLAVSGARDEVQPLLPDGAWIAVISGPHQLVVAGSAGPLADAHATLERAGLVCRAVPSTHPAHGPIAAPAVPPFDQALRQLRLAAPTIDFYSANTGRLASAAEATDPGFWSRQLVQPVVFGDAVDALTAAPGQLLMIEVGPGQTLTSVLRRHPTVVAGRHQVLPSLAHHPVQPLAQTRSALTALAGVWTAGNALNWAAVEDLTSLGRASVPGYPYERARHWVAPAAEEVTVALPPAGDAARPAIAVEPQQAPARPVSARPVKTADPAPTADRLRQLWTEILGEGDIGQDTGFFDLGGNSLTAVELMSRVRAEFDVELGVTALFDHPTFGELAAHIDRQGT